MSVSALAWSPAQATDFNITNVGVESFDGVTLHGNINDAGLAGGTEDVWMGRIQLSGTDVGGNAVTFDTYCADIFDTLQTGTFSTSPTSTMPYSAAKIAAATTFLAHADPLVVDATTSAAAQVGLWEILNENDGTPWDVTSGAFSQTSDAAITSTANDWLSDLASNNWQPEAGLNMQLLRPADGNQLQVRIAAASASAPVEGVPEPTSWALMLGGFGAIGAALRGNRRREEDVLA